MTKNREKMDSTINGLEEFHRQVLSGLIDPHGDAVSQFPSDVK